MSYDSGLQLGASIVSNAMNEARQGRQDKTEQNRYDEQAKSREVDTELRKLNLARASANIEAEAKLRNRDAANLIVSDDSWNKYENGRNAIAADAPDRLDQLDKLKAQYMPLIARHPANVAKFDAYDKADQATEAWIARSRVKTQLAAMSDALLNEGKGKEMFAMQAAVKSGNLTATEAIEKGTAMLHESKLKQALLAHKNRIEERVAPVTERNMGQAAVASDNNANMLARASTRSDSERSRELSERIKALDRLSHSGILPNEEKALIKRQIDELTKEHQLLTPKHGAMLMKPVSTKAEYEALPPGPFLGHDGKTYTKPGPAKTTANEYDPLIDQPDPDQP